MEGKMLVGREGRREREKKGRRKKGRRREKERTRGGGGRAGARVEEDINVKIMRNEGEKETQCCRE